ncbi:PTS sugar transporter subunit IIA [Oceanobacillus neutriphilus]|uniref:PTS fructose transporter subunit IIA n=1 Tax=Oceanobacillus neutriphilus TaxID=531815 RepID=A0ABQ2NT00_9BACI|nr:PTS fructose transporter subunit IIA [Oceanobacillus neutriphilus]GGP10194.1 PTS fructose transporter subunit IIA [Oceanobacillus neutriphilus]
MVERPKTYEILLLTHGGWGMTLKEKLTMIIGKIHGVSEVALEPSDTTETFLQKVKEKVTKMPADSLILTDIAGGTTSNIALTFSKDYQINILSGLNSMMLMEAIMRQNQPFTTESVAQIREAALLSCQHLQLPDLKN